MWDIGLIYLPAILTDFPRTGDLRTYHLGLRPGEVANRIVRFKYFRFFFFLFQSVRAGRKVTVGSRSRAESIASHLDASPKPFVSHSERDFRTITGCYKGVPISIVSIGMGSPNMDFFVREVRESLIGDMVVIR